MKNIIFFILLIAMVIMLAYLFNKYNKKISELEKTKVIKSLDFNYINNDIKNQIKHIDDVTELLQIRKYINLYLNEYLIIGFLIVICIFVIVAYFFSLFKINTLEKSIYFMVFLYICKPAIKRIVNYVLICIQFRGASLEDMYLFEKIDKCFNLIKIIYNKLYDIKKNKKNKFMYQYYKFLGLKKVHIYNNAIYYDNTKTLYIHNTIRQKYERIVFDYSDSKNELNLKNFKLYINDKEIDLSNKNTLTLFDIKKNIKKDIKYELIYLFEKKKIKLYDLEIKRNEDSKTKKAHCKDIDNLKFLCKIINNFYHLREEAEISNIYRQLFE